MIGNSIIAAFQGFLDSLTLSDSYNFIGSTVALILLMFKVLEYTQDQVKLHIDVEVDEFIVVAPNPEHLGYNEEHGHIYLSIIADIANRGRQPISISKVELSSPIDSFTNISLYTGTKLFHNDVISEYCFDKIRLESNDSVNVKIYNYLIDYVDISEPIDCTISFFTSHKTIDKKIRLNPKKRM